MTLRNHLTAAVVLPAFLLIGASFAEADECLCEHDPLLEQIRGQKRFATLMEQVKERWERFEV